MKYQVAAMEKFKKTAVLTNMERSRRYTKNQMAMNQAMCLHPENKESFDYRWRNIDPHENDTIFQMNYPPPPADKMTPLQDLKIFLPDELLQVITEEIFSGRIWHLPQHFRQ